MSDENGAVTQVFDHSAEYQYPIVADPVVIITKYEYTQEASGSISWTSPRAPVGSQYKAWAVGTRTTYNIQQWKITRPAGSKAGQRRTLYDISGQLAAFSPVKGFAVGQ